MVAREVILLGAGASSEAGLPTSYELTEKIIDKFKDADEGEYARISNYIIGGLLFQEGVKGNNPLHSKLNIEDFFNAVQLLANRKNLEVAPFLGSWHFKVEEFDTIYSTSWGKVDFIEDFVNLILKNISESLSTTSRYSYSSPYVQYPSGLYDVNHSISSFDRYRISDSFRKDVKELLPRSGEGAVFRSMANSMIRILRDILWIGEERKVEYLSPLMDQVKAAKRLIVATLNYDNAIELAAKSMGVRCETGISSWSKKGEFDISSEDGLILLKLHGSLDWERTENGSSSHPFPQVYIKNASAEQMKEGKFWPAVIFGQKNKLTAEGPFLDLLRAFQQELFKAEKLTIIGYSFGDDHINTYISQWLNQSEKHKLRIIDPKFKENQSSYAIILKDMSKSKRKQLKIIKKPASKGLISLYRHTQ